MYSEYDRSYWSKYREASDPKYNHLSRCKGVIDIIKNLGIWESAEFDLPMKSQISDMNNVLCDREFACGLTEDEWNYVGNALVTLPNYPTPLFFYCSYPILANVEANTYTYSSSPIVVLSFGLNNFEKPSKLERLFVVDESSISPYDISDVDKQYYIGDIVEFDGNYYRCKYDGCTCKPWDDTKNHWDAQYQMLTDVPDYTHKMYTCGSVVPRELSLKPYPKEDSKNDAICFKRNLSDERRANWSVGPHDVVYAWRTEDVPYARGTIVEYEGVRYKNYCDNAEGCSCVPVPYNIVPPVGCSGHWVPEYYTVPKFSVFSPALLVYSPAGKSVGTEGNFIISYLHDTLTFVDCTTRTEKTRSINRHAYFRTDNNSPVRDTYPFLSISPMMDDNNIGTDDSCDYIVFGGGWVESFSIMQFRLNVCVTEYLNVSGNRPNLDSEVNNPRSMIVYDTSTYTDSDFCSTAIINGIVDSQDGKVQQKNLADLGLKFSSDYDMKQSFTRYSPIFMKNLSILEYDTSYYAVSHTDDYIYCWTNYFGKRYFYLGSRFPSVDYHNMLHLGNGGNDFNHIHVGSNDRSMLHGSVYYLPVWVYVKREPVALDEASVVFRSKVWFGCDTLYDSPVSKSVVGNKTYLVFSFIGIVNDYGDQGVALLVDDREED